MTLRALALVGVSGLVAAGSDPPLLRTFDDDPAGGRPPGLTFAVARGAQPARWVVERQGDNGVLVHRQSDPGQGFALAVLDGPALRSVEASVRLRLVDGGRAGGLVWRYQDEDNYFLALLDLREQDLALYHVVRGNRVRLEDEDDLELDSDAWYTLKVRHEGERIRIYLGGIRVIEDYERSRPTEGRVGLWSADNSLSWFDDVRVNPGNERRHEGPRR